MTNNCVPATDGISTTDGADRTARVRVAAVSRAVRWMRQNLSEAQSLPKMAHAALLSPFHFHRVFLEYTAATPGRFLAALRMAEAKRQLAYTSRNVTDICMDVGYGSLGTFSAQFTRLVGISPRRFRQLIAPFANESFNSLLAQISPLLPRYEQPQVIAAVTGGLGDRTLTAAGLFRTGIPQEQPAACAIVPTPGFARFGGLDDGDYYALAMSFPPSATVAEALIGDAPETFLVGAGPHPVSIRDGRTVSDVVVPLRLRPREPIDPPVVIALPLLLAAEAALPVIAGECQRLET